MKNREIYVGQYQKGSLLVEYNIIRYTTFCLVLDYYCYMNSLFGNAIKSRDWLIGYVLKQSEIRDTRKKRAIIDTAISNMVMIGLLCENNGQLFITDMGKQAYMDQKYHMTVASLYEAKETRRLSRRAIVISVISLIVAIIVAIIGLIR